MSEPACLDIQVVLDISDNVNCDMDIERKIIGSARLVEAFEFVDIYTSMMLPSI